MQNYYMGLSAECDIFNMRNVTTKVMITELLFGHNAIKGEVQ